MGRFRKKMFFEHYTSEDYHQVDSALQKLGLQSLSDKPMTDLSGGEQQMVWICQCLLQNVSALLLDEPTQQLDPANKRRIFELLQEETGQGRLVICSTHDLHNLKKMKGYYINMSDAFPELKELNAENMEQEYEKLEASP